MKNTFLIVLLLAVSITFGQQKSFTNSVETAKLENKNILLYFLVQIGVPLV